MLPLWGYVAVIIAVWAVLWTAGDRLWLPTVGGWQFGTRIDHILTGPRWRPQRCWVGPDVGSDHLPLLADLTAQ